MDIPLSTRTSADRDPVNNENNVAIVDDATSTGELSPAERARLLRKLDRHILPLLSLLYFLSFL